MTNIRKKTYERNGIETTVDNGKILWLNEKHIDEGLGHKNLQEITIKYHSLKTYISISRRTREGSQWNVYKRKVSYKSNHGL